MTSVVSKLDGGEIYTVEILLEYTDEDLIGMGINKGLARTMLRKAREIAARLYERATKDEPMMLISMDVFKEDSDRNK